MRSSESALAGLARRLVVVAGLIGGSCSPVPVASQPAIPPPECTGIDARGLAQDAAALAEIRSSIEKGPFYAIGARTGVSSCQVARDGDAIRFDYTFRDGAALRVTRNPKIEYTDQDLRLTIALADDPIAILKRAEQSAFDAKGCGIDWKQPEVGPASDDPRATENAYRGEVCSCSARARSDASGRVVRLQFRSAC